MLLGKQRSKTKCPMHGLPPQMAAVTIAGPSRSQATSSVWVSHMAAEAQAAWAIFHFCPMDVSRDLDPKWSSWDSNWDSYRVPESQPA